MTRKDYALIANAIRTLLWLTPEQHNAIIEHFIPRLRVYPNFNEAKFRAACQNK